MRSLLRDWLCNQSDEPLSRAAMPEQGNLATCTKFQPRPTEASAALLQRAPSPLLCSLSSSSPSGCELTETSVIMDNTSHKAAREAVDLEVVDADLVDLVIECAHGLGRPRAS